VSDNTRSWVSGNTTRNGHRSGAAFRRFLLAMDLTLCRPGELTRLKWEHIRWDNDVAVLPDHKTKRTGRPKIIAIVPTMKRLLAWLKRRSQGEYCFENSRGLAWTISAIEQRMAHVKQRAGLTDVVPYTLRHRSATNALLATGNLKMTSLLLGHTSTTTTERYTHVAKEHLVSFARQAVGPGRRA
jgi:integrase